MSTAKFFYFGFAHFCAGYARPEFLQTHTQADHCLQTSFRVNGIITKALPFTNSFQLKPGDKLHSESPCKA
jgi:predicted metalloendopeptidase